MGIEQDSYKVMVNMLGLDPLKTTFFMLDLPRLLFVFHFSDTHFCIYYKLILNTVYGTTYVIFSGLNSSIFGFVHSYTKPQILIRHETESSLDGEDVYIL